MIMYGLSLGTVPSSVPTASVAPPALATPLGAPSGITAPLAGVTGGQPAPADLQCAVGNCRSPQANWHTGFCDYHQERYMTRVYEYTRGIGRGEL